MSQKHYSELWKKTQQELSRLFEEDTPTEEPNFDRESVLESLLVIYLRYIKIIKNLTECYDQMVQPQKRLVIRKLLDSSCSRLLEIRQEIVSVQFSEVLFLDEVMHVMQILPNDAQLPIPCFILFDQRRRLAIRDRFVAHVMSRVPVKKVESKEPKMSVSQAVRIIQRHERARQGRCHFEILQELCRFNDIDEKKRKVPSRKKKRLAATRCQAVVRQYLTRKAINILREYEFMWLGMVPPLKGYKEDEQCKWDQKFMVKQIQQINYEENYRLALRSIKDSIRDAEEADRKENLVAVIRQWFLEYRYAQKVFPDYPPEEVGGSNAIFKEQAEDEAEQVSQGETAKESKLDNKMDKKRDLSKLAVEDPMEKGWVMTPSSILDSLKETSRFYDEFWRDRDEQNNFRQLHDESIINEEKRAEVYEDIRIQVDELLREELKNLKLVVDGQFPKKSKKGKGKNRKKKKKKKKGEKESVEKTLESICQELVFQEIVRPQGYVRLCDFLGEFPLVTSGLREFELPPVMSLYEVRRLITEYAILPLGSPAVREQAPLIRSLMLVGPSGCGKKMLVNAICTETGAILLDLTAENLMGKYPGKEGLKLLMHQVFKVARQMQPAVILIRDCEKMFMKKVPRDDVSEPKRLKPDLNKALKHFFTAENRVLLVGLTSAPYNAVTKHMCQMYDKIIMIPKPRYGTRLQLWKLFVFGILGTRFSKRAKINYSALAKMSDGHSAGGIKIMCEDVLTERRIMRAKEKKIKTEELLRSLARHDPVYLEEEEHLNSWYATTPIGRKRSKVAAETMAMMDPGNAN